MSRIRLSREGLVIHPYRSHAWLKLLLLLGLLHLLLVRLWLVEVLLLRHVLLEVVKHLMLVHSLLCDVLHIEVQNDVIGIQFDDAVLIGFFLLLLHSHILTLVPRLCELDSLLLLLHFHPFLLLHPDFLVNGFLKEVALASLLLLSLICLF